MFIPAFPVTVIMQRAPSANQWVSWSWQVAEVIPDRNEWQSPTRLEWSATCGRIAHPGFKLGIFKDEAEGYYLNVESPEPAIFVVCRENESPLDEAMALVPHEVTVSYNEAARRMDAQEKVERVAMPTDLQIWLREWLITNYQPPVKKQRIRPQSFVSKEGRYHSRMGE